MMPRSVVRRSLPLTFFLKTDDYSTKSSFVGASPPLAGINLVHATTSC
jgi:hypothetical protein